MKYYELHDQVYRRKLSHGQAAWEGFDDFFMRPFLETMLAEWSGRGRASPNVLVLGCGTGPACCFLAERGAHVTGWDVSRAAIDAGRRIAAKRGLSVSLEVVDLCGQWPDHGPFDVIVDDHLLHCLVRSEERQGVLGQARKVLNPNGELWMETMCGHEEMVPREEWNLDDEGVSWLPVVNCDRVDGEIDKGGRRWVPQRFIAPSAEFLLDELRGAGLAVHWHEVALHPEPDRQGAAVFRVKCGGARLK